MNDKIVYANIMSQCLIHASCVAVNSAGVLLAGPPGIGKSDMALRLIDRGARLVADDQTQLCLKNNQLMASAPVSIVGMIEVRHIGLLRLPYLSFVPVAVYVELVNEQEVLERCPEPDQIFFLDQPLRRIRLKPYEGSSPAKIMAILEYDAVE